MSDVKVGQVWTDSDKRYLEFGFRRKLLIAAIKDNHAICSVVGTKRVVKIRLDRFKPNSTGYELIEDVQGV
jgi:hypothetical protein